EHKRAPPEPLESIPSAKQEVLDPRTFCTTRKSPPDDVAEQYARDELPHTGPRSLVRGDLHCVVKNYGDLLIELPTLGFGSSAWKSLCGGDRDDLLAKALETLGFNPAASGRRVVDVGMIESDGIF